jgi:hypothetical protein
VVRYAKTMLVLGCLTLATNAATAQSQEDVAGVYAVRRVVTSSTCSGISPGVVLANLFMISSTASHELSVVVAGTRRFPELRGTMGSGTLRLAGSDGEDGTIAMSLTLGANGVLAGTETVSRVERTGACTTVRSVTATPLTAVAVRGHSH